MITDAFEGFNKQTEAQIQLIFSPLWCVSYIEQTRSPTQVRVCYCWLQTSSMAESQKVSNLAVNVRNKIDSENPQECRR
jgi:hypothetical protein